MRLITILILPFLFLSTSLIAMEPTQQQKELISSRQDDNCAFCRAPLKDEPHINLVCTHAFHTSCFKTYLEHFHTRICPLDRRELATQELYTLGFTQRALMLIEAKKLGRDIAGYAQQDITYIKNISCDTARFFVQGIREQPFTFISVIILQILFLYWIHQNAPSMQSE